MNPGRQRRRRARVLARTFAFVAVLGTASSGCAPHAATEVVLRLDTDMVTGPDELSSVTLTVTRDGSLLQQLEYQLCPVGHYRLPGDVGFVALDSNATTPLTFVLTALHGRAILFERSVQVTPRIAQTLVVNVFLARRCVGDTTVCPVGQSCGALGCEMPQASVLPEDAARHEPYDAGPCFTRETGVAMDASFDATSFE